MERQFVVFRMSDVYYGVDIATVASIIKKQAITRMPKSPEYVEGVTNLRGMVLPVIDLCKRFGLSQSPETKDTRIIVTEMDSLTVGMVVDAVAQVLRIDEQAIEPPSPIVATIDSEFITGIAKTDERLIVVLDLRRVLSLSEAQELIAIEQQPVPVAAA